MKEVILMMLRYRFLVCMFLGAALFFSGTVVHADCFNSTVNFALGNQRFKEEGG